MISGDPKDSAAKQKKAEETRTKITAAKKEMAKATSAAIVGEKAAADDKKKAETTKGMGRDCTGLVFCCQLISSDLIRRLVVVM